MAPVIPATDSVRGAPETTYVLVGSEAEATQLRGVISSEAASLPELAEDLSTTIVTSLETPQQESDFSKILALASSELTSMGIGVNVVDLRRPAPVASFNGEITLPAGPAIFYVVGSEAEKISLQQQFHETTSAMEDSTPRDVIVVDSPERQELLNTVIGEQMATGAFEVVDLRN